MVASLPLLLKTIFPFLTSSKFMVTVSPVRLSLKVTVLAPSSAATASRSGLPTVASFAIANAGFCFTLWATNAAPAVSAMPNPTNNPNIPTRIQTIGLIFLGAVETVGAATTAGLEAPAATGLPHCIQKLLLVTSAPHPVQNAISPPPGLPLEFKD